MRVAIHVKGRAVLTLLMTALPVATVEAQRCPYTAAYYVVRGEDGVVLSEAELQIVYEASPKPTGDDLGVFLGTLLQRADGTYAHPNFQREGTKVPVLDFHGRDECFVHLREVTLVYHQRRMRLIFDVEIAPVTFGEAADYQRRPKLPSIVVVESPPFREGTFRLDVAGWLAQFTRWAESTTISAAFWKDAPDTQ